MKKISLPADDAYAPDELLQWWYWTGHLQDANGRRFGFEVAFFSVDLFLNVVGFQMTNFAITDIENPSFHKRVDYKIGLPLKLKNRFELSNLNQSVQALGGNGMDRLHGQVGDYVLDLTALQIKEPVLHYGGYKHTYAFGGNTYYYSRPWMSAQGTLTIQDHPIEVTGHCWFDHQWGDLFNATSVGWQWFALQLDDNTQIMLNYFEKYPQEKMGSVTHPDGSTTVLGMNDFTVEDLEPFWKSPKTGRVYPVEWRVSIGSTKYHIVADLKNQEFDECFLPQKYWEGSCLVYDESNGQKVGQAYVEIVNYTPKWLKELEEIIEETRFIFDYKKWARYARAICSAIPNPLRPR